MLVFGTATGLRVVAARGASGVVLPSSAGAGDALTAGLATVFTARPPVSVSWMFESCQVPCWSALKVSSWWAWKPVVFGSFPVAFAYVSVVVSVTSAFAVRPVTRVASSVTLVVPVLYVSPSFAMLLWRPRSWLSADFSSRDWVLERRTSPEKREVLCFVPAPWTSAWVRSVKTASASFWKVALVAAFTVGSSTTAAPALQLGTRATPHDDRGGGRRDYGRTAPLTAQFSGFQWCSPLRRYAYRARASSHAMCGSCEGGCTWSVHQSREVT